MMTSPYGSFMTPSATATTPSMKAQDPLPTPSAEKVRRHPKYYLSGGDIHFLVENWIFRVHRYFFERESAVFREMLCAPPPPGQAAKGSSDTNLLPLHGVTEVDFSRFLWVFYNPKYSIYDANREEWTSILKLSFDWRFAEVKRLATRYIEKFEMDPVDKIELYQWYDVDKRLLIPSYIALVNRLEPLNIHEGRRLSLETALLIATARECARGKPDADRTSRHSPTVASVSAESMVTIVSDVFGLANVSPNSPSLEPISEGTGPSAFTAAFVTPAKIVTSLSAAAATLASQSAAPTQAKREEPPSPTLLRKTHSENVKSPDTPNASKGASGLLSVFGLQSQAQSATAPTGNDPFSSPLSASSTTANGGTKPKTGQSVANTARRQTAQARPAPPTTKKTENPTPKPQTKGRLSLAERLQQAGKGTTPAAKGGRRNSSITQIAPANSSGSASHEYDDLYETQMSATASIKDKRATVPPAKESPVVESSPAHVPPSIKSERAVEDGHEASTKADEAHETSKNDNQSESFTAPNMPTPDDQPAGPQTRLDTAATKPASDAVLPQQSASGDDVAPVTEQPLSDVTGGAAGEHGTEGSLQGQPDAPSEQPPAGDADTTFTSTGTHIIQAVGYETASEAWDFDEDVSFHDADKGKDTDWVNVVPPSDVEDQAGTPSEEAHYQEAAQPELIELAGTVAHGEPTGAATPALTGAIERLINLFSPTEGAAETVENPVAQSEFAADPALGGDTTPSASVPPPAAGEAHETEAPLPDATRPVTDDALVWETAGSGDAPGGLTEGGVNDGGDETVGTAIDATPTLDVQTPIDATRTQLEIAQTGQEDGVQLGGSSTADVANADTVAAAAQVQDPSVSAKEQSATDQLNTTEVGAANEPAGSGEDNTKEDNKDGRPELHIKTDITLKSGNSTAAATGATPNKAANEQANSAQGTASADNPEGLSRSQLKKRKKEAEAAAKAKAEAEAEEAEARAQAEVEAAAKAQAYSEEAEKAKADADAAESAKAEAEAAEKAKAEAEAAEAEAAKKAVIEAEARAQEEAEAAAAKATAEAEAAEKAKGEAEAAEAEAAARAREEAEAAEKAKIEAEAVDKAKAEAKAAEKARVEAEAAEQAQAETAEQTKAEAAAAEEARAEVEAVEIVKADADAAEGAKAETATEVNAEAQAELAPTNAASGADESAEIAAAETQESNADAAGDVPANVEGAPEEKAAEEKAGDEPSASVAEVEPSEVEPVSEPTKDDTITVDQADVAVPTDTTTTNAETGGGEPTKAEGSEESKEPADKPEGSGESKESAEKPELHVETQNLEEHPTPNSEVPPTTVADKLKATEQQDDDANTSSAHMSDTEPAATTSPKLSKNQKRNLKNKAKKMVAGKKIL